MGKYSPEMKKQVKAIVQGKQQIQIHVLCFVCTYIECGFYVCFVFV